MWQRVNYLPEVTLLAMSKLKAFVDNNFNVAQMVQFFNDQVENIVGQGENAGYQFVEHLTQQ